MTARRATVAVLSWLPVVALCGATLGVVAGATPNVAAAPAVQPNSVQAFGAAALGDLSGQALNRPLVGLAGTTDGAGYWLVARDGGIFSFGDAQFHGSTGALTLNQPMVGMATDRATGGYWTVASDGGVFSFDSPFFGSTGSLTLNRPIVGLAATPDGGGYWLVAADGGIFAFGDAPFMGSAGAIPLNQPVIGMAATPDGGGYWLAARDGGIFTYGDAPFLGSALSGTEVPAIGITAGGGGYRVAFGHIPTAFSPAALHFIANRIGTLTAAVYDANTGQTWLYNPGQVQVTASIVKVDIMATAFEEAEQRGQWIPPSQQALMYPMIEVSDNNAATAMWNAVGGAPALTAYNRNFGLTATTPSTAPVSSTQLGWAFTTTSAADQVKVVRAFAFPNPILSDAARAFGLSLMEQVEPSQVWGVPSGVPGLTVALKTGNYPLTPTDSQVNSIGYVSGDGQNYVFAVLDNGVPGEAYGASTINGLATLMFQALASN